MIHYMKRIALKENEKRRQALIDILRELNCPYNIQCEKVKDIWVENIIVSFNQGLPKVILGAHYDTVSGSTGANDDASGVCILLKMVEEYLKTPPTIPLEIVFFDCEEIGTLGSESYLNSTPSENILAMINLDICGVGDTIVVAPAKNLENSLLEKVFNEVKLLGKHKVEVINQLPEGDDGSFESKKIPNISVCVLQYGDIELMLEMVANRNRKPDKLPTIIETIHSGPRDSLDVIEEKAMELLFNWTIDVIANFK